MRVLVEKRAAEIGLSGYVQNDTDGSVRIVARGNVEQIADLEAWLRAHPGHAHVETLHESPSDEHVQQEGFTIRYSP